MRILAISNFYPPHSFGGYEQWCQEVTDGLRTRGHAVSVLTSRFGVGHDERRETPWVHRDLCLEMEFASLRNSVRFFTTRHRDERRNLCRLESLVWDFNPDCILVWGMWNLHRTLPALAERLRPDRVAYYVGDYWPTLPSQYEPYWSCPARNVMSAVVKVPLRAVALSVLAHEPRADLEFKHAMFPTAFMRDELSRRGVCAKNSRVVYGAVDTSLYVGALRDDPGPRSAALRLLYAGRLAPEKGVETAIDALAVLKQRHGVDALLTVAGSGETAYQHSLEHLAQGRGVADSVRFLGSRPKTDMPDLYGEADVFLFPSIWEEPFGRTLVEAMASGLVVVGTATGGAREVLVHGRNALTFEPGDADALAASLLWLLRNPEKRRELAVQGRQDAVRRFDIERMTGEIEGFLTRMLDSACWHAVAEAETRADAR